MANSRWDPAKDEANLRKHGISFLEARSVVIGALALEEWDVEHSGWEDRIKVIGWSNRGRLLVVVVSISGPTPRIISARRATKREADAYTD